MRVSSRPAHFLPVFGFVLLAVAAPVRADFVTLDLTLVPATVQYNTVDLTAQIVAYSIPASDDATSTISGNVQAQIAYTALPAAYTATVTDLEFTGGQVTFSDVMFYLGFGILGSVNVDGKGLVGYPDTPLPPGAVTGIQFPANQHVFVLNNGTFKIEGSGGVGGLLDPNPMDFNLASSPLSGTTGGDGTLLVSSPTIVGGLATYDVTLEMPVAFNEIVYTNGTTQASVVASGTLRAEGQFTHALPEPATLVLILAGAAALRLGRRR